MRCGNPNRLISQSTAEVPSWSADGELLYFASNRTGRWEVWKQPIFGGLATQITSNGGYAARESPDGKWLYFSKDRSDSIWRMPTTKFGCQTAGGEELVIGPPNSVLFRGWTLTPDEIVFIEPAANGRQWAIRAYRISTKETRLILPLTEGFADSRDIRVSISPDSRWVVYSQLDRSGRDDVDIMLDLHARTSPAAIQFERMLVDFNLYWYEEPCWPEHVEGLVEVARPLPMPIATGERLVLRPQFRELFEKRACAVIQPDASHCGGISEARRIAAMAETYMISVACHNPQGPISTAASLHVGFATPNYLIQEVVRKDVPWREDVVAEPIVIVNGS